MKRALGLVLLAIMAQPANDASAVVRCYAKGAKHYCEDIGTYSCPRYSTHSDIISKNFPTQWKLVPRTGRARKIRVHNTGSIDFRWLIDYPNGKPPYSQVACKWRCSAGYENAWVYGSCLGEVVPR
jgi:hypothetical protein